MKFFSRLAASAALAATLVAGAMPAEARSNGDHHIQLLETVRAQGINVQVNPAECFEDTGVMGFYSGQRRLLVILYHKTCSIYFGHFGSTWKSVL